jgi:hypothetical protein
LLFAFLFVEVPQSSFVLYDLNAGSSVKPVNATLESIPEVLDELDIVPLRCHSHNDYQRKVPIVSALIAGCTGLEADIWLAESGQEVVVGHDRASATKTLRATYLDPLLQILDFSNKKSPNNDSSNSSDRARGLFSTRSDTPVVLLVDVKQSGAFAAEAWQIMLQQLEPFRRKGYLRRYESGAIRHGPLVVVASGEMTLDILLSSTTSQGTPYETYHDTFLDAPLRELNLVSDSSWKAKYNDSNSYYASVSLGVAVGSARFGFSRAQYNILRRQLRVAQESSLYSRYWGLPKWPVKYRDYVWSVLAREEVGMLNVDDVNAAARQYWTTDYLSSVKWMTAVSCVLFVVILVLVVFRLGYFRTGRHSFPFLSRCK